MEDKKVNHEGNLNPFYGHRHSAESRQKISNSQKARYQQYRSAIDNIHHVDMNELLGIIESEAFREKVGKIINEEIKKII